MKGFDSDVVKMSVELTDCVGIKTLKEIIESDSEDEGVFFTIL